MSKSIKPGLGNMSDDIPDVPPPAYSEKTPLQSNNPYQRGDAYTGDDKLPEKRRDSRFTSSEKGAQPQPSSSYSNYQQNDLSQQFSHMSMGQSRDLAGYPPPMNPNAGRPPQVGMPPPMQQGPPMHQGPPMPMPMPMAGPGPSMGPPQPGYDHDLVFQPGGVHPCIRLPLCFNIYADSNADRVFGTNYYIGRSKGDMLHLAPHGFKGLGTPKLALHAGPDKSSPVLGSAVLKVTKIEISLSHGTVILQKPKAFKNHYFFDFPIQRGAGLEKFEWERGESAETKKLGKLDANDKAWTLRRAKTGEPVAVYQVCLASSSLSGQFAFMNSGASPEYGPDWCVMAVVSAMCMGEKKRTDEGMGSILP